MRDTPAPPETACQPLPPGIVPLARIAFDDYVAWYLAREARKGRRFRWPHEAAARRELMERAHAGKLLPGIAAWQWWQGQIRSVEALAGLMIPLSSQSIAQGLIDPSRPRTVGVAAERLLSSGFFERVDPPRTAPHPFRRYYRQLAGEGLSLRDRDRLALRSLTPAERRDPAAAAGLYLLDGVGRGLPYLTLVRQGRLRFRPIEVYVALSSTMVFTWPAAALRHRTGEPSQAGTRWLCVPGRHPSGHAVFGPYASLPAVPLAATFHFRAEPGARVASVDVYDARRRQVLASQLVQGGSRARLSFTNEEGGVLEFRVYWHGDQALELERVDVSLGQP